MQNPQELASCILILFTLCTFMMFSSIFQKPYTYFNGELTSVNSRNINNNHFEVILLYKNKDKNIMCNYYKQYFSYEKMNKDKNEFKDQIGEVKTLKKYGKLCHKIF